MVRKTALILIFTLLFISLAPLRSNADPLDDINKQLADAQAQQQKLSDDIAKLSKDLGATQSQVDALSLRVQVTRDQISQMDVALADRQKKLDAQIAIRDARVRTYYKNNQVSFWSKLFGGDSLSSNAENLVYQQATLSETKRIIGDLNQEIAGFQKNKEDLVTIKKSQEANLAQLSTLRTQIASRKNTTQNRLSDVNNQIKALTARQQQILAAKQASLASATGKSIDTQTSSAACGVQSLPAYPSTIRVKFTDNHVEALPFEDQYLKGLAEMPRAWESESNHSEAFKAQVIAARSYALYKMVRSGCRDFDVYSDTRDQAYGGQTGDGDWNGAVDATRGQFMQNGSNVIIAYYSANAGGYTLTPNQAWGAGGDFPSGVNDIGPDGRPNGDLNARCIGTLRWEYHYNVGRNGQIQFNDTCGGGINNDNSPMTSAEVEDIVDAAIWTGQHGGQIPDNSMSHDQIKADLGANAIGPIQAITANIAGTQYTSTVHVIGSNTIDLNGQTFRMVFNIRSPEQFLIPSTSYGAQFVKFDILTSADAHGTQGPGWYFYTYGYGHRIGLDQEGALGMASQSIGYTNIISHYYQGTSLTPINYSGAVQ